MLSDIISGIQIFATKSTTYRILVILLMDVSIETSMYYLHWSDVVSANIGKVGDDNFDSPSMIFGYDVIEPKSKP